MQHSHSPTRDGLATTTNHHQMQQPSSNATTLLLPALLMTWSNPNTPKLWTCSSGGSEIASDKDNSRSSGPPEKHNTANNFTKHFLPSHHTEVRPTYLHLANHIALLKCERVLISLPVTLVTESLFHSTNDIRKPACSKVDLLAALHNKIPKEHHNLLII